MRKCMNNCGVYNVSGLCLWYHSKRKLAEAKADLQAWEGSENGEGGGDIHDCDIALVKREIATFEQHERLWVPEPLARA